MRSWPAERPLIIITSYLGRNLDVAPYLASLSETLAIPVFLSCPTVVNIPFSHKNLVVLNYEMGKNEWLENADCVLVLDSDIPWIPLHTRPKEGIPIFHVDVDPLKQNVNVFRLKPVQTLAYRANSSVSISGSTSKHQLQKLSRIDNEASKLPTTMWLAEIAADEEQASPNGFCTVPATLKALREAAPKNTIVLSEAISNYPLVWKHLQIDSPGKFFTSGGSSLGWGLGAAMGMQIGEAVMGAPSDLTVLVVGDGSFLSGIPSTAYWMSRRYKLPFLCIVLNNGGWKSPRLSILGVHPEGVGSKSPARNVHVTFGSDAPSYGLIASAAGGAWYAELKQQQDVAGHMKTAFVQVRGGRSAVFDIWLDKF